MSLRLAVATEDFGSPLKSAIAEASRCLVDGIRLNARTEVRTEDFSDTALRQLKHFVAERRMSVAGLMFSSRFSLQDPEHLDQRIDGIRAAMPLVRKLGTSELLVRCGRIPNPDDDGSQEGGKRKADESSDDVQNQESRRGSKIPTNSNVDSLLNPFSFAPAGAGLKASGPSPARQFATLCDILNDLVRYGSHVGCHLQLQLQAFDTDRISRLLAEVKSGPVGLVFDPATAVMTGRSPVGVFRDLYRHVSYIRARDASADIDGAGIEMPLGDGSVDWTELIPTFAEADYQGWVCVERTGGDQRAEDVRRGVSQLRTLILEG